MNSTMKTVCLLYSSISLSKATQLIEEMPIGVQGENRCDPRQKQRETVDNKPLYGDIVPLSQLFDRGYCNWALPHDTNPCEWDFGVVRNYGNTYSIQDDPISIIVNSRVEEGDDAEAFDAEMDGWDEMHWNHPRYWYGLGGITTEEFFKEAHDLDPSLGLQQYMNDGWTAMFDHAIPSCCTVGAHPFWYREKFLEDAKNFAAGWRSWGLNINALEITKQGHLLYKTCQNTPAPVSAGYTVDDHLGRPNLENRFVTLTFEEYPTANDPKKFNYLNDVLDEKDGFTKVIGRRAKCTQQTKKVIRNLSNYESIAEIKQLMQTQKWDVAEFIEKNPSENTKVRFRRCAEMISPAQTLSQGNIAYTLLKDKPSFLPVPDTVKNALTQHQDGDGWIRVNGAYPVAQDLAGPGIKDNRNLNSQTLFWTKEEAILLNYAAFSVKENGAVEYLPLDYRFDENISIGPSDESISFFFHPYSLDRIKESPVTLNQQAVESFFQQTLPFDLPVIGNHSCGQSGQYDSSFLNIDPKWNLSLGCSLTTRYDGSWTQIGNVSEDSYSEIVQNAESQGFDNIYFDKQGVAYGIRPATRHYSPNALLVSRLDKDLAFHLMLQHPHQHGIAAFGPNYWGPLPMKNFEDWFVGVPGGPGITTSTHYPLMVWDNDHNKGWMDQFLDDPYVNYAVQVFGMYSPVAGDLWTVVGAVQDAYRALENLDNTEKYEVVTVQGNEVNIVDGTLQNHKIRFGENDQTIFQIILPVNDADSHEYARDLGYNEPDEHFIHGPESGQHAFNDRVMRNDIYFNGHGNQQRVGCNTKSKLMLVTFSYKPEHNEIDCVTECYEYSDQNGNSQNKSYQDFVNSFSAGLNMRATLEDTTWYTGSLSTSEISAKQQQWLERLYYSADDGEFETSFCNPFFCIGDQAYFQWGKDEIMLMLEGWRGYMNDYDYIWGTYGFGSLPSGV